MRRLSRLITEHNKNYAQEVKLDKKIVQAVLERSKGLCEVCYAPGAELHHIEYLKQGYSWESIREMMGGKLY